MVAPAGEERCTPHYTVPVSPQCPQETELLTLPPPVLHGTAVSSECTSQCPSGNVEALGGSQPLRRSPVTPEVSLERLIPLVYFLAAWKLLPNISKCVLQTLERGYKIQFGSLPPHFNGIVSTGGGVPSRLRC